MNRRTFLKSILTRIGFTRVSADGNCSHHPTHRGVPVWPYGTHWLQEL